MGLSGKGPIVVTKADKGPEGDMAVILWDRKALNVVTTMKVQLCPKCGHPLERVERRGRMVSRVCPFCYYGEIQSRLDSYE